MAGAVLWGGMKFTKVLPLILAIVGCTSENVPSQQDEEALEQAIRNQVYPRTIDTDSVEVDGCVIMFTNVRSNFCDSGSANRVLSEKYRIDITDFSEDPDFMFVGWGNATNESILTWMLNREIQAEYDQLRLSDAISHNANALQEYPYSERFIEQGFRSVRIVNLCQAEPELNTFWPGAISLIVDEEGDEIINALRSFKQKFC